MNVRKAEDLFELPHRRRYVHDYYAGMYHGDFPKLDKQYRKYLLWLFGFEMKPGDVLCAYVIRNGAKPKKKAKRKS